MIHTSFDKKVPHERAIGIEVMHFPPNEVNKFWVKIHLWAWQWAFYYFKPL